MTTFAAETAITAFSMMALLAGFDFRVVNYKVSEDVVTDGHELNMVMAAR